MSKSDFNRLELRIDRLYEMLEALQQRLDAHISNHHSKVSALRQGSVVGVGLSLLYALVELLRRFAF